MDNDIALIKTAETIEFDDQQKPISISNLIPKPGDEIEVPGIEDPVTSNMFCAGKDKDDTCEGDSSGAVVINGKLVGIVSWGFECGASKLPSVYTLAKNYHEWISNHTGLILY
ncbi:trypsin II-P29-like [Nasonia vitripennis]|uniref:Peptidase S1 domain-containing protein n=1 Tax=Nasonia vitripennis TaxID=7425 RepID=A0A7M7LU65_NASVI|nr:trypsin II-P29-like [Nasonia vitripennis]